MLEVASRRLDGTESARDGKDKRRRRVPNSPHENNAMLEREREKGLIKIVVKH